MENYLPAIRIGHLRIIDHMVLGVSCARIASDGPGALQLLPNPVPMNSWDRIIDGLVQKTLDAAFINTPLAMELCGSGIDLKLLMFVHRSGSLLVKSNAFPMAGLSGFKGKSVLVPAKRSIQALLFHRFLAGAGLTLGEPLDSQVAMETAAPVLMPHMIQSDEDGDIAGFMAPEPFGSLAVYNGSAERVCTSDSLWANHPCCAFVVTQSAWEGQGEGLAGLITHFFESAAALHRGSSPGLDGIASEFTGQATQIVPKAIWGSGIRFNPEGLVPDPALLDQIQTYMTASMGTLPGPVEIQSFLDTRFAEKALAELTIEN